MSASMPPFTEEERESMRTFDAQIDEQGVDGRISRIRKLHEDLVFIADELKELYEQEQRAMPHWLRQVPAVATLRVPRRT